MNAIPLFQVDAFAERPFAGNPAAVCLLDSRAEAEWMQAVAAEMNLSETAFLHPHGEDWDLRWFTPAVEVELCGHATLASAHVLWESGRAAPEQALRFHTLSGALEARRRGDRIEIDLPAEDVEPVEDVAAIADALGVAPRAAARGRLYDLVEVGSVDEVRAARPDFPSLREASASGVILTSRADAGELDFVSRFFAPSLGVDEDPVTGSAHCALAGYWARRLGRSTFEAAQLSRRGGRLGVSLAGGRVTLTGRAVTVLRGELLA